MLCGSATFFTPKSWVYSGNKLEEQGNYADLGGHYRKFIMFNHKGHFPQEIPEYATILVQEILDLINLEYDSDLLGEFDGKEGANESDDGGDDIDFK